MNKPHKVFVLLYCISLLYAGCKKEEEIDKLPPATASGLGTFGCLINGKAWPIYEKGFHYVQAYYENGVLSVGYYIKASELSFFDSQWVRISTKNITKPGNYIAWFDTNNDYLGSCSVEIINNTYDSHHPINAGGFAWVNITRLDTVYGFAAGMFGFTLLDDNGLTSVKVESGRFDISY
ncbi:MAG: hypothetical protein K1X81_12050 [Bacteroidia bacterium]|nr:hypothetical protein [Bacteroidia bacterium]